MISAVYGLYHDRNKMCKSLCNNLKQVDYFWFKNIYFARIGVMNILHISESAVTNHKLKISLNFVLWKLFCDFLLESVRDLISEKKNKGTNMRLNVRQSDMKLNFKSV